MDVTYLMIMTIMSTILVVTFIFIFYYAKNHQEKEFEKYERDLMAAKLEVQELTFQAIAHEIHCHINNSLILSRAQLNNVDFDDIPDARRKISASSELIDESIQSLRTISKTLNTNTIKNIGLTAALRNEINYLNISGLFTINAHFDGTPKIMSGERELLIYRIAQEVFNNIMKHSMAKEINISLNYYQENVDLIISDNGIGFNYLQENDPSQGEGLNNIKVRTQVLKGKIDITSVPNEGTSICVSVPYN